MRPDNLQRMVRAAIPRPVRNWVRSPSKSAEWIWDTIRFSLGSVQTIDIGGGRSLLSHPHAYKVALQSQVADPEQRAEFQNFLSNCYAGMFLFDIGAHFGIFSLAAALFDGRAIAIDPSPIATRMIGRQVTLNQLSSRIQILQLAVSEDRKSVG